MRWARIQSNLNYLFSSPVPAAIEVLKLRRSTFLEALEDAVKGRDAGEAGPQSNLRNGQTGVQQVLLGLLDPALI